MENKCVAYIRVSTGDQNNSLIVQEKKIIEYCRFKELDLVEIIADEDVSGGKEFNKRPGGSKICQHFENGIKTIIAIKPDRLFRNVKDALITVDDWTEQEIDLHIIDMGGSSFTTNTAIGRLFFTTVISFAEFERNITCERTRAVLQNRKSDKKSYSPPVLGYDKVDGTMVPNPEEQEIINYIKIGQSKGCGPTRIAKALNRFGYRTKTKKKFLPSTIQAVMGNSIHG